MCLIGLYQVLLFFALRFLGLMYVYKCLYVKILFNADIAKLDVNIFVTETYYIILYFDWHLADI